MTSIWSSSEGAQRYGEVQFINKFENYSCICSWFLALQEEERRLREEHIQYQQQQGQLQRKRLEDILVREELAKKNVMQRLKERRKALMRREV